MWLTGTSAKNAFASLALSAAALGACANDEPRDPLADVIARNTAARGGAKAIEHAESVEIRMQIVEPKMTVDGVYRATRDGKMRIDVYAGGKRVYSEGLDGQRAWTLAEGAAHAEHSSPTGAAALRHGLEYPTNLRGLYELTPRGNRLAYNGRELLDGVNYHVLQLVLTDGFVTYFYVNPTTYLIARQRDERALHPDADPSVKWLEHRFADYRPVDGRLVPFRMEQYDIRENRLEQTAIVAEVRTNPTLDAGEFQAP
jgi:hypothetical protein